MKPTYEELEEQNAALVAQFESLQEEVRSIMANIGAGATFPEVCEMLIATESGFSAPTQHHLRQVRADAVNKFAEHVFTGTDCLHINLKAAANQYAASILAGKDGE